MTKSRFITHTITNAADRTFAVRYVPTGGSYGLEDCLINERGPMIEFYSMQEDDSTRFIARYYVETFLDRKDHHGLSLYVGDASYDLTAANCNEVARELPVEDLRDALAESAEVLALAKRQDGGASVFRVKVRRVLVETAHIVVEAADEDEAGEMAIEQAQFGGAEWTADSCDDSCFEVSETEEVEEN